MRLSSNSAPALAQVTTVPGPTVQAASMDQYSMEMISFTSLDGFTFRYMALVIVTGHFCVYSHENLINK